jgi:hypothetical protein
MSLPVMLWEEILYHHFVAMVRDDVACRRSSSEYGSEYNDKLLPQLRQRLAAISSVHSSFYRICHSNLFLRNLFEITFPLLSIQDEITESKKSAGVTVPWSRSMRDRVLSLSKHSWRFLWKAIFAVHGLSERVPVSQSHQVEDVVVWLNPSPFHHQEISKFQNDTEEDNTIVPGSACLLRQITPTQILLFSSDNQWILFHRQSTSAVVSIGQQGIYRVRSIEGLSSMSRSAPTSPRYCASSNTPLSSQQIMKTRNEHETEEDEMDQDPISWRPPKRMYVFEDLITMSSQMNSLHFLRDENDPPSLHYSKCQVCFNKYPICGKVMEQKTCGSCLYLLDMDLYNWNNALRQ